MGKGLFNKDKKEKPENELVQAKQKKPVRNNKIAFKGGSYSLIATAIVLAIVIAINVFVSQLPTTITRQDISASNLYSVTSSTKSVVNALEDDVDIYWIVQSNEEDSVIETLLDKYDSLSDHITVTKKNPDEYPTFAEQYTDETVANNSLIVVCGDKSRFISYDDIYQQEVDYTTYSYSTSFDGEGQITSAIGYVTSDELPKIYVLTGHGETDLPDKFSSQIERENYETEEFSLLNESSIPDDAACILIYGPTSDISSDEKTILADYLTNGGKLLVFCGTTEDGTLSNLTSLLSDYNVTAEEGIVIEGDRDHYAFQTPYVLMPDMASSEETDPLISDKSNVIVPVAQGLTVGETDKGTVTSILTTSDDAFSKVAGYSLTTYDKEDGDIDGGFAVGVQIDTDEGGEMIWVSSSVFVDDTYNEYSSGANLDFAMNSISSLVGQTDSVSIRSKSMSYSYLTISESSGAALKAVMIAVIPGAIVAVGIIVIVIRRRRRDEKE